MDLAQAPPGNESNWLRNAACVVVGAVAIFALNWIPPFDNQLWLPTLFFGPLLTGIVMRLRGWPWKLGAVSWGLMGLIALFWDWIIYNDDKAFHAMLTITVPVLVAIGAAIGHVIASARLRASGNSGADVSGR